MERSDFIFIQIYLHFNNLRNYLLYEEDSKGVILFTPFIRNAIRVDTNNYILDLITIVNKLQLELKINLLFENMTF